MSTGNQTFKEAWATAANPENVEHAQMIFDEIGVQLTLLLLIPFGFMFVYAGLRGEWERTDF